MTSTIEFDQDSANYNNDDNDNKLNTRTVATDDIINTYGVGQKNGVTDSWP